jgi:hypothetical protein
MATMRLNQLPPIETVDGYRPASLLRLDAEFKAGHIMVLPNQPVRYAVVRIPNRAKFLR